MIIYDTNHVITTVQYNLQHQQTPFSFSIRRKVVATGSTSLGTFVSMASTPTPTTTGAPPPPRYKIEYHGT